jgi:glucosamine-6-phosphate deaminase
MRVIVTPDFAAMSQAAADFVVAAVTAKPDAAVVFPTGNTPVGLYQELAIRRNDGLFDPSRLRVFQLDEYWGLHTDDPRSFHTWMRQAVLTPLGIPEDNFVPLPADGGWEMGRWGGGEIGRTPYHPATLPPYHLVTHHQRFAACQAYDAAIVAAGGLDLAVLGLGPNGHLGYNDPPAAGDAPTRLLTLSDSSLDNAASYFGGRDRVPRQAITMGMAPLLAARQILLIVSGKQKQKILRQALQGPVTPETPASYLQQAPNVTVIADRDAASLLDTA